MNFSRMCPQILFPANSPAGVSGGSAVLCEDTGNSFLEVFIFICRPHNEPLSRPGQWPAVASSGRAPPRLFNWSNIRDNNIRLTEEEERAGVWVWATGHNGNTATHKNVNFSISIFTLLKVKYTKEWYTYLVEQLVPQTSSTRQSGYNLPSAYEKPCIWFEDLQPC